MAKIIIKRGLQENVQNLVLSEGELAVALDTGNVYIGTTAGTTWVNPTGGESDTAKRLSTSQKFKITGDGTASEVSFDGTAGVNLVLTLANSGIPAGEYTKVTYDVKGRAIAGTTLAVADIPNLPTSKITGFPTNVSSFTNDAGYATTKQVSEEIAAILGSAPELLNSLDELAAALGDDPNFATTMATELGNKEALIKNASAKTTIVDADTIPLSDSAAQNGTKKITYANLKSGLKGYFDQYYNSFTYTLPTASASTKGGVKIGTGLVMSGEVLSLGDVDGGTF